MYNLRFTSNKGGKHSCGAIYVTILNNPLSKRFRREETILACVIPGPNEPSLEELNFVMEPLVDDLIHLECGVEFKIPGKSRLQPGHGKLYINVSDLPASRKISGLRSVTSKRFMCTQCHQSLASLTNPSCFDPLCKFISARSHYDTLNYKLLGFQPREDWHFIKYAFLARNTDAMEHREIADKRGARWSALNLLADWLPGRDSPLEFMHAVFLRESKHVLQEILVGGGMFTPSRRGDKLLERFDTFLESIWWPAAVTRPPRKVSFDVYTTSSKNSFASKMTEGSPKADQWRNLSAVLVIALYHTWQVDGVIPDEDAPHPNLTSRAGRMETAKELLLQGRRREDISRNADTSHNDLEVANTHTHLKK